jgi:hypothetical protein
LQDPEKEAPSLLFPLIEPAGNESILFAPNERLETLPYSTVKSLEVSFLIWQEA